MSHQTHQEFDRLVERVMRQKISRREFMRMSLALGISLPTVGAFLAACAVPTTTAPQGTSAPPAATSAPPAATQIPSKPSSVNLEFWWEGERNVNGLLQYYKDSAKLYRKDHPEVASVAPTLQGTDEVFPAVEAAIAAQQGPEAVTMWYGIWPMLKIWTGNFTPVDELFSQEEISHWQMADATRWNGHGYGWTQWVDGHLFQYNKKLFAKAGLDPEKPPITWDEFIAVLTKLKAAGVPTIAAGAKDGWEVSGEYDTFALQDWKNYRLQVGQAVLGEIPFTDPSMQAFWDRIAELRDRGFYPDNIREYTMTEGRQRFQAGEAAIQNVAISLAGTNLARLGEDNFGVFGPPKTTQDISPAVGDWGLIFPKFAPNTKELAGFLTFLRTPERLTAQVQAAPGALPADDRFNPSVIDTPGRRQLYDLTQAAIKAKRYPEPDITMPDEIFSNGMVPAFQRMFSEKITAKQAAEATEKAAQEWRTLNPDLQKPYRDWLLGAT